MRPGSVLVSVYVRATWCCQREQTSNCLVEHLERLSVTRVTRIFGVLECYISGIKIQALECWSVRCKVGNTSIWSV